MMELEEVVKKVEAKMKKEELEMLSLEYEENLVVILIKKQ
jgi:hypothetical protein